MLKGGAVREVLVSRHDEKWALAIRLGGAGSRRLPVRSRLEALNTWVSVTAVGRFMQRPGIETFIRPVNFASVKLTTSVPRVLAQGHAIFSSSCPQPESAQIRQLIFRRQTIFYP